MPDDLVIFGAAVRHGGAGPVAASYLPSGGLGRHGPAEALVMHDVLLDLGAASTRILLEREARDTLESVQLCTRILQRRGDVGQLKVSTSSCHGLRCALLFRLAGFDSAALPAASDRPHRGWGKWLRYVIKNVIATPWDSALLLLHRFRRTI